MDGQVGQITLRIGFDVVDLDGGWAVAHREGFCPAVDEAMDRPLGLPREFCTESCLDTGRKLRAETPAHVLGMHGDLALHLQATLQTPLHTEGALRAGPYLEPRPVLVLDVGSGDPMRLQGMMHLGLRLVVELEADLALLARSDLSK